MIIRCPKCGWSKTRITNTIEKEDFIKRYRICNNSKCRYKFGTTEMMNSDWMYKNIVMKIKNMLKDVK